MPFYPKVTAKQENGDDGYCYVIRIDGKEYINGLTRNELPHYKGNALLCWYVTKLRAVFAELNFVELDYLARDRIKANKEYNYKTPRKPIAFGCCRLAMSIEGVNDRACYCPIHGEYPAGVRGSITVIEVSHAKS